MKRAFVKVDICREQGIWHSPIKCFREATKLLMDFGALLSSDDRKIAEELQVVSVFALCNIDARENMIWLQLPQKYEATPDVYIARFEPIVNMSKLAQNLVVTPIEVVEMREHTEKDIASFLKDTKFEYSGQYSTIVMFINKHHKNLDMQVLSSKIQKFAEDTPVHVLCKTSQDQTLYQCFQLSPFFGRTPTIDLDKEISMYKDEILTPTRGYGVEIKPSGVVNKPLFQTVDTK